VLAACRREVRPLVRIAIPIALAQMAQNGMSLIDTLMTGRLGPEALAGIAIGAIAYFTLSVSVGGVLFAIAPLTAQAIGAGREFEAARAARHGVLVGLALALPVMAVLWWLGPLLPRLGQDPTTAAAATGYLRAILWGVPGYMIFVAMRGTLEGRGHTRPIMLVAFLGVGLNVAANYALMFGNWGFPALGLTGAGVATAIVYTTMAALLVAFVANSYRAHPVFVLERWRAAVVIDIVRLGVPIALTVGFEIGLFASTAFLMGLVGQSELAAHQIAIQTVSFTFMIPLGLGIATTARVGQAAGRRDARGARAAALVGVAASGLVMVGTAVVYWTLPQRIVHLYLDVGDPANAAVVGAAVAFLRVAALFQIVDGLQVTVIGALRGLKDTRVPMWITLVSYWFVGVTSAAVLAFGVGMGGIGLWLGLVVGLGTAAALLSLRYWWLQRQLPSTWAADRVGRQAVDVR
jgi:multidrug resistance protein, MATE family